MITIEIDIYVVIDHNYDGIMISAFHISVVTSITTVSSAVVRVLLFLIIVICHRVSTTKGVSEEASVAPSLTGGLLTARGPGAKVKCQSGLIFM